MKMATDLTIMTILLFMHTITVYSKLTIALRGHTGATSHTGLRQVEAG